MMQMDFPEQREIKQSIQNRQSIKSKKKNSREKKTVMSSRWQDTKSSGYINAGVSFVF